MQIDRQQYANEINYMYALYAWITRELKRNCCQSREAKKLHLNKIEILGKRENLYKFKLKIKLKILDKNFCKKKRI